MPGFIGAIFKVITDEAEKYTSISKERIVTMVTETMYATGKLLVEKNITFNELINRVSTKGGVTEEGTKVIYEKLPQVINEMFEKTSKKIELTIEKTKKAINS
jgi:pyrroline-5-carboxylate reductase